MLVTCLTQELLITCLKSTATHGSQWTTVFYFHDDVPFYRQCRCVHNGSLLWDYLLKLLRDLEIPKDTVLWKRKTYIIIFFVLALYCVAAYTITNQFYAPWN